VTYWHEGVCFTCKVSFPIFIIFNGKGWSKCMLGNPEEERIARFVEAHAWCPDFRIRQESDEDPAREGFFDAFDYFEEPERAECGHPLVREPSVHGNDKARGDCAVCGETLCMGDAQEAAMCGELFAPAVRDDPSPCERPPGHEGKHRKGGFEW